VRLKVAVSNTKHHKGQSVHFKWNTSQGDTEEECNKIVKASGGDPKTEEDNSTNILTRNHNFS
jgi:hypothetical protein